MAATGEGMRPCLISYGVTQDSDIPLLLVDGREPNGTASEPPVVHHVKEEAPVLTVTVVVGNPKPRSRTRQVAEALVSALVDTTAIDLVVIDLIDIADRIFTWPEESVAALNDRVAASDLVVVASPTYKAAYSGLLKSFLDRYSAGALTGVVAVPVMTGADATHTLAPETTLRPLLVELGATVPTRAFYFEIPRMGDLDTIAARWATDQAPALAGTSRLTAALLPHLRAEAVTS